jgi:ribosomal protein S18 acetylase RimI-like enzyme
MAGAMARRDRRVTDRTGDRPATLDITEELIPAVVRLHGRVFPDSVLTELGSEALDRYYRWQLLGPHEVVAFGVELSGDLVGLLVGGRFRGSMIGFVKGNASFLVGRIARRPSIAFGPRGRAALRTGLRLLLRPTSPTRIERPERVPDGSFGVLVVAVDPQAQRAGVGRALLEEAEHRARAAGFERLHLTLDPSNWSAAAFYREQGWERLGLPGDTDRAWLVGKELTGP